MDDDFENLYQDYVKNDDGKEKPNATRYKTQFEDVTQLSNPYGDLGDVFKTSDKQSREHGEGDPSNKKFGDVALLLRRMYHWDISKGEHWTMRLELQSPVLRNAFKEIAKGYTSTSLEQNPIIIDEPFSELYFCREKTQAAIQNAESDEVKVELELLETFRRNYMKTTITALETARNEGLIDAGNLWSLFPIGSKILLENRETSGKSLFWCVNVKGCFEEVQEGSEKSKIWNVQVEFNSFDGRQYVPVWRTFSIGGFVGARPIRSLPAYPLSMHPQKENLERTLVERGRKHVDLCLGANNDSIVHGKGCHRTYKGPFWMLPESSKPQLFYQPDAGNVNFHAAPNRQVFHTFQTKGNVYILTYRAQHDGRLVVDPSGFMLENPEFRDIIAQENSTRSRITYFASTKDETRTDLLRINVSGTENSDREMTDDDLITLPATIPAYSLSYKLWGLVDVDSIDGIKWKDDLYDMLQMESDQKEMVRGIIESHHASSSSFDDFIPGKGRGLVFLLHGPPGCGKTLTAGMAFGRRLSKYFLTSTESAAETLHRPLYYVSGAELGLIDVFNNRINSIEDQLELIFKRIARWEAILLFDEAESFVASRDHQSGDGRKHALTSILLRMLEYQSGIVFLTTNRLSDFDTALFSRVHITLKFEQLSAESCEFIWKSMAMQTEHSLSEEDFKALSRIPLDGRTIKNILRVASLQVKLRLRMESGGDKKLQMKDVKKVLRYTAGSGGNELVAERLEEFYR